MMGSVPIFLLLSFPPMSLAAAFDANGVALGAKEAEVKRAFPSVHCKPLEWASRAADRRCDGSRLELGGVEVRITFYLRKDALEAFDVRFSARDLERFADFLKGRFGAPQSDEVQTIRRHDRPDREVRKILWQGKGERAELSAQLEGRRASLLVSRGNFEEEIYR